MSSADIHMYKYEKGYPRQELRENPLGTHSSVARVLVAVYEVVVVVVVTWIFGFLIYFDISFKFKRCGGGHCRDLDF